MDANAEAGAAELECGICYLPYDRQARAPRRLGPAHGAWRRPAPCRHALCTACLCRLARDQGWEAVTCPFCRTLTSLRVRSRGGGGEAGTRWRSSSSRRRLALPPVDPELWKRIGRREGAGEQEEAAPGDDVPEEAGQSRLWRALKKLLRGGGGGSRSSARERQPINPYGPEMKDLALMTCYIM
ncbi:RING finger protein 227 [Terrapene carolina triunguis]|uniref:RING finger protein 227 n=1 Tax=Terrapene triunguis TaxID=2587831 RepID=UPI000E77DDAE|nr:RING finger protein 227 [Terrapene carolina triunguis]